MNVQPQSGDVKRSSVTHFLKDFMAWIIECANKCGVYIKWNNRFCPACHPQKARRVQDIPTECADCGGLKSSIDAVKDLPICIDCYFALREAERIVNQLEVVT